jgi:precorrin-6B methylase 2
MTRSKTVAFRAGEAVRVDLTVEDPADRVRVIYVPTPVDVSAAMVDLAGVGRDDVVYEPGCGDARITVAAIRAGARRGICVDIDAERARESKANVEAAGFANRIDVREGDALDVKNLSDVSVVFLYMGDHFNLLVRPVLWRELKVGSRIVSHRFTMGDWPPDKTISVTSDLGGIYELHLWTITEEIKQRQGIR